VFSGSSETDARADWSAGLPASREVPRPPEAVALWSETYAFLFYDPEREIGVWLHVGRFPYQPHLWRTMFSIFLPDGRRLVGKNYERGDESRGPAGAVSSLTCEEPFRRWRWRYDGPAQLTTVAELGDGPLRDGRQQRLEVDLSFDARGPVWDMSPAELEEQDWGTAHYQQLGTCAGEILTEAGDLRLDGTAWRDHSYGTRDMDPLAAHSLVAGYFEETDLGFTLFQLRLKDGSETRTGLVTVGGRTEAVQGVRLELLADRNRPLAGYSFSLPVEGRTLEIAADVLHTSPLTMIPPNHAALGVVDEPGALVLWESHVRFSEGRNTGFGYTERSQSVPR
jgi:hypothetical protein